MTGIISSMSRPGLPLFSNFLLYREVALRVPSALMSLTSVFGMGTGVSSLLSSLYYDLTQKLVFAGRSDVAQSKSLIWLTEPTFPS